MVIMCTSAEKQIWSHECINFGRERLQTNQSFDFCKSIFIARKPRWRSGRRLRWKSSITDRSFGRMVVFQEKCIDQSWVICYGYYLLPSFFACFLQHKLQWIFLVTFTVNLINRDIEVRTFSVKFGN